MRLLYYAKMIAAGVVAMAIVSMMVKCVATIEEERVERANDLREAPVHWERVMVDGRSCLLVYSRSDARHMGVHCD